MKLKLKFYGKNNSQNNLFIFLHMLTCSHACYSTPAYLISESDVMHTSKYEVEISIFLTIIALYAIWHI